MNITLVVYSVSAFILLFIHHVSAVRCKDISLRYGRVKYRSRGRVAIFGCWTGFTLYGEKYAGCFRAAWDVAPPKCVMRGCSEVNLQFGTIKKPLFNTAVIAFKCFPGYNLVGPSEIYCNGNNYDNLPPVCKREETDIACDFESQSLCKWRNDILAQLTFSFRQGETPSRILNTGPDHDHTLYPQLEGQYIYLESSSTNPGEAARIFSPYLPHSTNDNTCFTFWYHMYGSTTGALRVYINDTKYFEREGNRGDRWRLGKVKLPSSNHFKIVIEAVTGKGYTGDIAIDDLDFAECSDTSGTTCDNRCSEDENDEFASCDCHPQCFDQLSCCADYRHYCDQETMMSETDFAENATTPSEFATNPDDTTVKSIILSGVSDQPDFLITDTDQKDFSITETDQMDFSITDTEPDSVTDSGKAAYEDYHEADTVADNVLDTTTENIELDFIEDSFQTDVTTKTTQSHPKEKAVKNIPSTTERKPYIMTEPFQNGTREVTGTSTLRTYTHGYNLRPRTTTSKPTIISTVLTTHTHTSTSTLKPSTKVTTLATTKHRLTTRLSPIYHRPVTMTSLTKSIVDNSVTVQTSKRRLISTKDPKITTPFVKMTNITSSQTKNSNTVKSNIITSTMKIQMIGNTSVYPTITDQIIKPQTERSTKSQSASDMPAVTTKWKSKYKPKGAYKLIVAERRGEEVGWAGVSAVILAILVAAGSAMAVLLFLRNRRLSSGPSDGADILFIPADEMLDFTPASRGNNRDSGVYSETVTRAD